MFKRMLGIITANFGGGELGCPYYGGEEGAEEVGKHVEC